MEQCERLALAPKLESIRLATQWLAQLALRQNVPEAPLRRLDLCLHEVLANILAHGGVPAESQIFLDLRISVGDLLGRIGLEVSDPGHPFDPLGVAPHAPAASLELVEPGGLGLVMIRRNADTLAYRWQNDLNILHIGVAWNCRDR